MNEQNQPNQPQNQPEPSTPEPSCCSTGHGQSTCICSRTPWIWLGIPLLVLILVVLLWKGPGPDGGDSGHAGLNGFRTDYQAALEDAKQQGKPVLIAFSASWCPPCQDMKENVYPDPKVQALFASIIPIYVDTDENAAIANEYGVNGIPAYVVLSPAGDKLDEFVGYHEPQDFVNKINRAIPQPTQI